MSYQDYRYVFLISYARSGSTLVQSLLNSLPDWQIRGENSNALFHMFNFVEAVRHARNIHGHNPTASDTPWYGAHKLTPRLFKDRMLKAFVEGVLKPDPGVRVTGFKEIRHTPHFMPAGEFKAYMQFILDSFPESRIVFNSRKADEVSRSGWLRDELPEAVLRDIVSCDHRFSEFAKSSDRAIHIRYEEYTSDRDVIRGLFDFLGETFDSDAVETIFEKPLLHGKIDAD